MVTARAVTAEELLMLPDDGYRYELVQGELIKMAPTGGQHGVVVVNITAPLAYHVKKNNLGLVCGAETGFRIGRDPDTVLAPDVAFISRNRIPANGVPASFWEGPPDLAIEVASPGDSAASLEGKALRWLHAGAKAVWCLFPKNKRVVVYPGEGDPITYSENDLLDGGSIVPGFQIQVRDIFI